MKNILRLFTKRRFFPLFFTQFLGAFNDNLFKNALVILALYRIGPSYTSHTEMLVTWAAGIFILPFFLFSAFAGQIADKYERASLIVKIKFAEIILMGFAALGFYLQNIWILFLALFLVGTQATFFGPVKYAILPDQLKENELVDGNAWIEGSTFIAILLGTIGGGLLILSTHGIACIAISIITVALLGWLASQLIIKKQPVVPNLKINWKLHQETKKIMLESTKYPEIFRAILGISWFWFIGAIFLAQIPAFVKNMLYANEQVVSLLFTLFSVGIAIGAFTCAQLLKSEISARYTPISALGISLFTLDLCLTSKTFVEPQTFLNFSNFLSSFNGIHIILDILLLSICGGIYIVPLYVILQNQSPKHERARMISSNNIFNALFMVIAMLFTLFLFSLHLSVAAIFLIMACMNILVAIVSWPFWSINQTKKILKKLFQLLFRIQLNGLENYPTTAPRLVIVANHVSLLDGILLWLFLPSPLTFVINIHTIQKWWAKWIKPFAPIFLVDSSNPMAIKSLIEYIETNQHCVIFPEGRMTTMGGLMKIYEGPALVTDRTHATLLPIHIEGAQYSFFSRLRGKTRQHLFPKITISIFPSKTITAPSDLKGRKRRKIMSQQLYQILCEINFLSQNAYKTLFQSLIEAKKCYGKNYVILKDTNYQSLTYHQLMARSFIFSNMIQKITQPSETIGILLPNTIAYVVIFFGLQACSRIPALLNFAMNPTKVVKCCQIAALKTVITSKKFVEVGKLNELIAALKTAGLNILFIEDILEKIGPIHRITGYLQALFPSYYYTQNDPNNCKKPAIILFTSGSEGDPKGVLLSHYNLQSNIFQILTKLNFNSKDIVLNALPFFHAFSFNAGLLLPIFTGVCILIYTTPLHLRKIPELCYEFNVTALFSADTFLAGYAKYANPYDFYTLRYIFAGAEKLKEETRKLWLDKFGLRIFEGYGATETAPVLALNNIVENKPGTVGKLLPGIQYQLKPVEGISSGGELYVKGPNIMLGYLRVDNVGEIEKNESGWYATGDIVSIDEEGFITIQDRRKRFAKIGGEMIPLTEIEICIRQLWPGFQHAVIAQPDPKKGEHIILFTTYPNATRQTIVEHAKQLGLSNLAIPKQVKVIFKMPLLATGKIDYPGLAGLGIV